MKLKQNSCTIEFSDNKSQVVRLSSLSSASACLRLAISHCSFFVFSSELLCVLRLAALLLLLHGVSFASGMVN
jgi:hypothetical protein